MTGLMAEGGASECGLGTGGTRAFCSWDFSSREGKGWLDGPTRTHNLWSAARVPQVPQRFWVTADEPLNMGFRTLGSQPTKGGAASSTFLRPLFDVYMPAPPVRSVLKQPSNNLPGEFGFLFARPFGPCAPSKLDGCIDNHLKDD